MADIPARASSIQIGDRVEMRKPHACGGSEWTVYRVGADIGLRCLTCGRLTMLPRATFNKRLKRIVQTVDR
jgi:hypothetical protein